MSDRLKFYNSLMPWAGKQIPATRLLTKGLDYCLLCLGGRFPSLKRCPTSRSDPAPSPYDTNLPEQCRRDVDAVVARHIGIGIDAVQLCQNHVGLPAQNPPYRAASPIAFLNRNQRIDSET